MVTGAVDAWFIDTNVLVYATVATAPHHGIASARLSAEYGAGKPLWVSRQILREYLAVLSRPQTFTPPLTAVQLIVHVRAFQAQFLIAEEDNLVTDNLLNLLSAIPVAGKQVHDANIVASMQAHGISQLLTANPGDFARFSSIITVVPLAP
jgi:predicted nucleic acid-binding protein